MAARSGGGRSAGFSLVDDTRLAIGPEPGSGLLVLAGSTMLGAAKARRAPVFAIVERDRAGGEGGVPG